MFTPANQSHTMTHAQLQELKDHDNQDVINIATAIEMAGKVGPTDMTMRVPKLALGQIARSLQIETELINGHRNDHYMIQVTYYEVTAKLCAFIPM